MYWTIHLEGGPQRVNHAAVPIDYKIYSFGGYCSGEGYVITGKMDVHVLDTDTLRWYPIRYTDGTDAPCKLYGHTVVAYERKIYLWGGRNDLRASNRLHCFDIDTCKWSIPKTRGVKPKAADGHSACTIGNYMYIFGGFEEETEKFGQTVYRLNFSTFVWEEVETFGEPPSCRDFHTASVIGKRMYIFGGRSSSEETVNGQIQSKFYCNKVMYLNTESMKWVTPEFRGTPPCGRRSHSSVVYRDELYIIGGYNAVTLSHLNDIYKYNPDTSTWIEMHAHGEGPHPRRRHCTCVVGDQLFLFGGSSPCDNGEYTNDDYGSHKLIDHSDLHVLDFTPTLKRLCQLTVIKYNLNIHHLPRLLMHEIKIMKTNNIITRNDYFPRKDFGVFAFSA